MYEVLILWQGNIALLSEDSDFYPELRSKFPIENKSKEDVEDLVLDILDNLSWNHYGLFSQQTNINHEILF